MKVLALERESAGAAQGLGGPYLEDEARRVWELTQAGIVREAYFRTDRPAAVLVLECSSVEEAHATLATLPLVSHGVIQFELIPLKPYPGFARLFR